MLCGMSISAKQLFVLVKDTCTNILTNFFLSKVHFNQSSISKQKQITLILNYVSIKESQKLKIHIKVIKLKITTCK